MIGAIASAFAKVAEVAKEGVSKTASKGLEKTSPFEDSARPTKGNMELPKLKDSDRLSETKRFVDSDRPSNSSGIEQPKLKAKSETKENNVKDNSDIKKTPDINETRQSKTNPETTSTSDDKETSAKEGLTDVEKQNIKEETGWSDEIVDSISSSKEYEIYKNAELVEADIGEKKCLISSDIDWNQSDSFGRTNQERSEHGLAPLNKDGKPIELHHIGQNADSPLAELTQEEHRGKGNDSILHNKNVNSEIDRPAFATERSQHWQSRANERGTQR